MLVLRGCTWLPSTTMPATSPASIPTTEMGTAKEILACAWDMTILKGSVAITVAKRIAHTENTAHATRHAFTATTTTGTVREAVVFALVAIILIPSVVITVAARVEMRLQPAVPYNLCCSQRLRLQLAEMRCDCSQRLRLQHAVFFP